MGRVLLVVSIVLALVLALFGIQNPQPVIIQFLNIQTNVVPLYVVMLVSALAGVVLTMLAGLSSRISQTMKVRRLERRVAELEKEVQIKSSSVVSAAPSTSTTIPATSRP